MSITRVTPGPQRAAWDHDSQVYITLAEGMEFDSDDPIVAQHPAEFTVDADAQRPARKRVTAVETTSAEPGTKRNR